MKRMISSCVIAFSTYSRIPMPQVDWNEENMRHTLAFFPLVGAAVGDGFCDTVDALSSHAPREKKLAILKDSNAGAFAVIWCGIWLLLYFALLTELHSAATAAAGFVLSRSLSALAVERLPSVRPASGPQAGMGAALKKASRFPRWALAVYLVLYGGIVWLWGTPAAGLAAAAAAVCFYFFYRRMALRLFGGFTGDLAGWFLQVCELLLLAAVVAAERVAAVWF